MCISGGECRIVQGSNEPGGAEPERGDSCWNVGESEVLGEGADAAAEVETKCAPPGDSATSVGLIHAVVAPSLPWQRQQSQEPGVLSNECLRLTEFAEPRVLNSESLDTSKSQEQGSTQVDHLGVLEPDIFENESVASLQSHEHEVVNNDQSKGQRILNSVEN